MPGSSRSAGRTARAGRDQRVDALRGVAVLSMFVAHCAPTPGPLRLFNLSEFLTAPLFALLIGVGAQLADRGARGLPVAFVRAGIRAAVLVALSLWLTTLGAQVDIVLMYLALPTLLSPVLARLPSVSLGVLACACWAAAPTLQSGFNRDALLATTRGDTVGADLWNVTFTGPHYRLTGLLIFTCVGILVQRAVSARSRPAPLALAGLAMLGVAAMILAAKTAGRLDFSPYDGSRLELFFDLLLAAGLALVWLALIPPKHSLGPLPICGSMTLSVYTVQIIYLSWYVTSYAPGQLDDSWMNVGILCAMGLALPVLWRSLVRRQPWVRGPIEGPTALVTGIFR